MQGIRYAFGFCFCSVHMLECAIKLTKVKQNKQWALWLICVVLWMCKSKYSSYKKKHHAVRHTHTRIHICTYAHIQYAVMHGRDFALVINYHSVYLFQFLYFFGTKKIVQTARCTYWHSSLCSTRTNSGNWTEGRWPVVKCSKFAIEN